jgi:hypothetical protein
MSNSNNNLLSRKRPQTRTRKVFVILSWGSEVWYRLVRPEVTVGELRHQLAGELGRLFDGGVVGLELLITGNDVAPAPLTPLSALTHPLYQNVCFDVVGRIPPSQAPPIDSIGEHLLRKHLCQERFQAGVDQRLWRLIKLRWPHAVFGISTRFDDGEVALRLNLAKYPTAPPLVEFWNLETERALEPQQWPEPFIRLAASVYPEIAEISPGPYCFNLLRISTAVATRQSKTKSHERDVTQDLTQLLSRASGFFR